MAKTKPAKNTAVNDCGGIKMAKPLPPKSDKGKEKPKDKKSK